MKKLLLGLFFLLTNMVVDAATGVEVSGSATSKGYPPKLAFDGQTTESSFWEAVQAYPISVTWKYAETVELNGFDLSAGAHEPGRMPIAWILEGGDDLGRWFELDHRVDQPQWSKSEVRTFDIAPDRAFSTYRLTFLNGSENQVFRIYEITPHIIGSLKEKLEAFVLHPEGVLEWPHALRISKSEASGKLPDFEDGRTRARPGGSLVIQPLGDLMRGAIDLLPTLGASPDTGAHAEITLHRRIPGPDGYEMASFAALARDDLPFGLLLEKHGEGKPSPFVFMNFLENSSFTQARFYESLRITENGTLQVGRKRGFGSTARLQNNDPTQVDVLFIERDDPKNLGHFDSDYFMINAKSRTSTTTHRYDWRLNVQLSQDGSSLVVGASRDGSNTSSRLAFHENGTLELTVPGAGIVLQSSNGNKWLLTVDNHGHLTSTESP